MPSAFITGATGQDGSYLVEQLGVQDWEIHALVRRKTGEEEQSIPKWVVPHFGDLRDFESVATMINAVQPDTIFNLAGMTSVAESWNSPMLTAQVTGFAAGSLMEAAWQLQERLDRPVRFIQASSSEIFGNPSVEPQNEDTLIRPQSPYGAAKAYAHHLVSVYRTRGLFASAAILYNHESPRRPSKFVTRKITHEVAKIAKGHSTSLTLGNMEAKRDWGWAPDYVEALISLAGADDAFDVIISTGELHTVRDFVEAAFAAADIEGWESLIEVDPQLFRPVDATRVVGDNRKAQERLNWRPSVPFPEIVARMVQHDLQLLER